MKKVLILTLFFLNYSESFSQKIPRTEVPRTDVPRICYEIFVRSFADSNNDGIGDINGITSKLDYLKDLGVEALWLTPVCKSSSYHKYDVVDYLKIDPECGTLEDYKHLIAEAHKRNILIIKDLVINHTSNKNLWFVEASKEKDNPYRNFYTWKTPKEIDSLGLARREAGGGSWELKPWHFAQKGDEEKYYGLFSGTMPDLNYDNPRVREEIYKISKYWLKDVGVDGFRMDAAKHIYPDWEAEKSHAFWQEFRHEMEKVKPNVYIVGEVWTSAEKVAPFFKGLPANFHFDMCFTIQRIAKTGKDENLIKKLLADYQAFSKEDVDFIDATIIGNHDQTRIGSIVNGDKKKMKVAANLLLTLPGQPYIYYGEELGMLGKKPDEFIREPFLWDKRDASPDRTKWIKPRYSTDSVVTPLKFQQNDENSMYNHYKKLIAFRNNHAAIWQISPPNLQESAIKQEGIIAFIRPHESGDLLVIHNVSGEKQVVNAAELAKFKHIIFKTNDAKMNQNLLEIDGFGVVVFRK
jgi:alpha-amylase